jgi:hypothetical protein
VFWSSLIARVDGVTSSVIGDAAPGCFCPSVSSEVSAWDVIFSLHMIFLVIVTCTNVLEVLSLPVGH